MSLILLFTFTDDIFNNLVSEIVSFKIEQRLKNEIINNIKGKGYRIFLYSDCSLSGRMCGYCSCVRVELEVLSWFMKYINNRINIINNDDNDDNICTTIYFTNIDILYNTFIVGYCM